MLNRKSLPAIALFAAATVVLSSPTFALDRDAPSASELVAEAKTYGVPQTVGKAAGQVVAERDARRNAVQEKRNANEQLWYEMSRPVTDNE